MSKESITYLLVGSCLFTRGKRPSHYGVSSCVFSFGLYVIFRSLDSISWICKPAIPSPLLWKTFPGLANFRATLRTKKKTSSDLELLTVQRSSVWNGCLKPPRCAFLETPDKRLHNVRIRWKVIRLNLAPIFRLIPAVLWWVCCGFFFGAASLNIRKLMNFLILSKRLSPKKKSEYRKYVVVEITKAFFCCGPSKYGPKT